MSAIPVGTILPFAGEPTTNLESLGWLVCGGREVRRDEYSELFSAIGSNFGSASSSVFNLPDLRGFFVRCSLGAADPATRDPDVALRYAFYQGGNRGNAVGSMQHYATAKPANPFQTKVIKIDERWTDWGCDTTVPHRSDYGTTGKSSSGGDSETRPDNRYVVYIVKYCSMISGAEVVPPVGAVLPWAAPDKSAVPEYWLECDGGQKSRADFDDLFGAIGCCHGAPDGSTFNLPDYGDAFLRGVDMQAGRDKDAQTRAAPKAGGNDKERVGSIQDWATALPVSQPFEATVPYVPTELGHRIVGGYIKRYYCYNQNPVLVSFTALGGDDETRPLNKGVDWLIRDDDRAALPLGAVIFTGMDGDLSASGFLPCDGSSLLKTGYAALSALLGTLYGGDATHFNLPDYRGYFLRGKGAKTSIGREYKCATGLPRNPITGLIPHLPVVTAGGSGETRYNMAGGDSEEIITTSNVGGDNETRPVNIYLNAYIKVAEG
jgi:microcystin-dependent protein